MNKVSKSIVINASPQVVWETVVDPRKYEVWTRPFSEGSYFEGGWNQGDSIYFLSKNEEDKGEGMAAEIAESRYPEFISIRHIGFVSNGKVDTTSEEAKAWAPAYENYTLEALAEGQTRFTADVDTEDQYLEMFENMWPKALEEIKDISEKAKLKPIQITIRTFIPKPIEAVWEGFTNPEHITKWNHASDDWHCPEAENHFTEGGTFSYLMASKDGKTSFKFGGKYTKIISHQQIWYTLGDGREVSVVFSESNDGVAISETFDAETANNYQMQRQGWQAILDNFADYVKNNL